LRFSARRQAFRARVFARVQHEFTAALTASPTVKAARNELHEFVAFAQTSTPASTQDWIVDFKLSVQVCAVAFPAKTKIESAARISARFLFIVNFLKYILIVEVGRRSCSAQL
jgi:hypothetical protein